MTIITIIKVRKYGLTLSLNMLLFCIHPSSSCGWNDSINKVTVTHAFWWWRYNTGRSFWVWRAHGVLTPYTTPSLVWHCLTVPELGCPSMSQTLLPPLHFYECRFQNSLVPLQSKMCFGLYPFSFLYSSATCMAAASTSADAASPVILTLFRPASV